MKKILLIFCILIFSSLFVFAEIGSNGQVDLSLIEEAERQYIIEELTYRLDTKSTCTLNPSWDDAGSGADLDGYFYIPSVGQSEYIIGGFVTQDKNSTTKCVVTVSEPTTNPQDTPQLLIAPISWEQVWNDKGSGARKDGSMWKAILPDNNYICLGNIPQIGYEMPNISNYRCVHKSLTEKIVTNIVAWSDKGSGVDVDATMFRLPNTGSFVTVPAKTNFTEAYDLKANTFAKPDPQIVESILAKRMVQIKADMESELKAKAEQQKKEAEQKRIKVAKQKRLAEEAEQKRGKSEQQKILADEAEQERLAEEAEQKRLKAEQQKILADKAEQERIAKEAEKERLAEEAEQERLAEEAEKEQLAEETEQKHLAEENEKMDALKREEEKIIINRNNCVPSNTESIGLWDSFFTNKIVKKLGSINEIPPKVYSEAMPYILSGSSEYPKIYSAFEKRLGEDIKLFKKSIHAGSISSAKEWAKALEVLHANCLFQQFDDSILPIANSMDDLVNYRIEKIDVFSLSDMSKVFQYVIKYTVPSVLINENNKFVAEQNRLADEAKKKPIAEMAEAEEQKRLSEKAEKKRLAEEAEQERLAEEAEKKRLAEEAEKKRLAKEAERQRAAEELPF